MDAAERRIKTYSGGMKRRLDLASALVHGPGLLFLDEPTEGLDPASRQSVWQEVNRLNKELGMTVFLTTHYLEEADRLADRVAIIDHGQIVADGTPTELKASIGGDIVTVAVSRERLLAARSVLEELDRRGRGTPGAGGANTVRQRWVWHGRERDPGARRRECAGGLHRRVAADAGRGVSAGDRLAA